MVTQRMKWALAAWLSAVVAGWANPPPQINYQGRLLLGTNLVQGEVALRLRLFNQPTGGVGLYEDTGTVTVVDGLYATVIGDGTYSGDLLAALTNEAVYLEVEVNGSTLVPRERLQSAAYALRAGEVDPVWTAARTSIYSRVESDARFATGVPVYVESDPVFTASVAWTISAAQTERWERAFGWGNHATNGYLTGFSEFDPLWAAASNAYYSKSQSDARFATGLPLYVESDVLAGLIASNAHQTAADADARAAQAQQVASNAHLLASGALPSSASNAWVQRAGDTMSGPLYVPALITRLTNLSEQSGWAHLEMWEESARVSGRIGLRHASYDPDHYVLFLLNNAAITGSTWFADDPAVPASRMALENNYNNGSRRAHEFNWDVDNAGDGINFRRVFNIYAYSDGLDDRAGASFFLHKAFFSTPEGLTNLIISAESDPGVAASSWPYIRTAGDLGPPPRHGLVIGSGYGHLYLQHDLNHTNHVVAAVPSHNLFGIGTESPTEKLTVSGNILATGQVSAASFAGAGDALTGVDATRLGGFTAGLFTRQIVLNGVTNSASDGVLDLGTLSDEQGTLTEVLRGAGSSERLSISNGPGPIVTLNLDVSGLATGIPVYIEGDPAFTASVAWTISAAQTDRWETAFAWGDHATNGYLTSFTEVDPQWAAASNAYYTKLQSDVLFSTGTPVYAESDPVWSGASNLYYQRMEADALFATGLPVYVESDPVFTASVAWTISAAQTDRWETAFAWGDHATNGYLTSFTEVDPQWAAASNAYYTKLQSDALFSTGTPVYAESDPVWGGASNLYYQRTEADALFATGLPVYVESDPVFTASVAGTISAAQTDRWETAFAWGDHATNGYLTSFSESDPQWAAASNAYYTKLQSDALFSTGTPVYAESDPVWGGASNLYYQRTEADALFATGLPVYVESDPVFTASVAWTISAVQTDRWETAFAWGDHATNGYLTSFIESDPQWSTASNAYYTKLQSDALFSTGTPVYAESDPVWGGASNLYYQRTEADALFATGLPVYVESDPVFTASVAWTISAAQTDRWETAFGWGDHATNGYLTSFTESDPQWSAASNAYYTKLQSDVLFSTGTPVYAESDPVWGGASNLYYQRTEADALFATGLPVYVESDPVFTASVAWTISAAQTDRWETAFGWGDHATNGYLTSFTEVDPQWAAASNAYYTKLQSDALFSTGTPVYAESDPVFTASVAWTISAAQTDRWETAFGWGDHATNGYLTSFTEVDPQWAAASNAYYTKLAADARFATGTPVYVEADGLALLTNGTRAMAGNLNMGGRSITNVGAGGLRVGGTQLVVLANGNIGIGTANPTNTLAVNGSIKAREVIVTVNNWPDYVFDPAYRLRSLDETATFIERNGHLPDLPSARQVEQEGVPLGELGAALLRKVEELTLHQLELKRENDRLRAELERLSAGTTAAR